MKRNMDLYLKEDRVSSNMLGTATDADEALLTEGELERYNWKPAKFISYEAMGLTTTKLNTRVRPCGFKVNGKNRIIKSTCLLARIKKLNMLKNTSPKLAVCITMYNENESELITTMKGVL